MKKFKQIITIICPIVLLFLSPSNWGQSLKTRDTVLPKTKKAMATIVGKSSLPSIENIFNSKDTRWSALNGIHAAQFIQYKGKLGYQFICDFSKVKDRCVWDANNLDIDLSKKDFISFDIDMIAPDSIGFMTFYLCFEGKWVYQAIKPMEGRQKIIIDLNSEKFAKVKSSHVTAIRVSPWKSNNNTAKLIISNLKSGAGKMLILPNKVWYKKVEEVIPEKDSNFDAIKKMHFTNYASENHLFLIGKPAKLIIDKGFLQISKEISIECKSYSIDEEVKKLIKKYTCSPHGNGKIKIICTIDANLSMPSNISPETTKRFKSNEAYYIKIEKNKIILTGRTHLGILRGLASIALIGSSQKSKKERIINCAEIWDAPSVRVRMYESSKQSTMQKSKEIIDLLYLLRYNAHTMQVLGYAGSRTAFPFDSLPEHLNPINGTKDDWKELMKYYKNRGIEFIPKIFSFSRAGIILSEEKYKHLAETKGLNKNNHKIDKNNQNFCSSNPESYKLVFSVLDELIDTLHPKTIHIALDEIMLGNLTCDKCPVSKKKSDWLKSVILKTHEFLSSKGVTTLMYGDMLDPSHHGYQIDIRDWKFADNLPKDIIIADWNYNILDKYSSISTFTKLGFRTLGTPWDEPENWFGIIKEVIKDNAYGICGTSWGSIYPSNVYHSRATSLSLGASLCWSPLLKSMKEIPVQPVSRIYKQICYPEKMELPYAENIQYITIKNNILTDEKLADAMHFPLVYDFKSIIAKTKNYRGVSFNSFNNKAKMSAMVLLPKTAPVKIKIAKKAKSITFLHSLNKMRELSGNIPYQKYRSFYAGKYIIRYEDGKTKEITIEYLKNITGWNSRMLASFVETGVFGTIGNQIHINIPSYTWINPFPNKEIREIEVEPSNHKDFTLVLYGLSIDN